jgi:methionyl-tRNA synthetase
LPGEVLNQKLNLPYDIPANQFLNLQGGEGKVSKSKGTTLTASQLIDQYNVDLIRYFFVRNAPENHDRDFVFRDFVNINNQELVGIFGNFIYRTLSFLDSRLNNDLNPKDYTVSSTVKTKIEKTFNKVGNELSHCKFVKASEEFMSLARFGNKYFNDNTPWVTLKNDIEECKQTIYDCIQIIYALAIIAKPFMPDTSKKILLQLGVHKKKKIPWEYKELKEVSQNKSPIPLFSKLENVKDN